MPPRPLPPDDAWAYIAYLLDGWMRDGLLWQPILLLTVVLLFWSAIAITRAIKDGLALSALRAELNQRRAETRSWQQAYLKHVDIPAEERRMLTGDDPASTIEVGQGSEPR